MRIWRDLECDYRQASERCTVRSLVDGNARGTVGCSRCVFEHGLVPGLHGRGAVLHRRKDRRQQNENDRNRPNATHDTIIRLASERQVNGSGASSS